MDQVVQTNERIIGFDVARALAILGMVIVNFKIAMQAETGNTFLIRFASLFEGRAAALFVVLAGVGIALLSHKARKSDNTEKIRHIRNILSKRALFLFVFGLIFIPIWPADILHFYGIYILGSVWFLTSSHRNLWLVSGGAIVLSFLMLILLNYEAGWDFDTLQYVDFWTIEGMLRHLFFNGFHPVFPWIAFLMVGLWLGQQDIRNPKFQRQLFSWSLLVVIATEIFSAVMVNQVGAGTDLAYLFATKPMPPSPFYIVAATASALAVIMVCLLVTQHKPAKWWFPLIATGQLALTLYVAHVIFGMGIMDELGMLNQSNSIEATYIATGLFYGGAILFATMWRKYYSRGPLESVMRRLTA